MIVQLDSFCRSKIWKLCNNANIGVNFLQTSYSFINWSAICYTMHDSLNIFLAEDYLHLATLNSYFQLTNLSNNTAHKSLQNLPSNKIFKKMNSNMFATFTRHLTFLSNIHLSLTTNKKINITKFSLIFQ